MGRDKLGELEEELSVWFGVGRAFIQEMFQGRGAGMLVYREETSTVAMMVSGGRGMCRDRIISRKRLISWTWEGRELTNGWRWMSM